MNSNTFQDNPSTTDDGKLSYKFGSLANADPAVREVAVEHKKYVIDLGVRLGSTALTVWLADGINHPGQADHTTQFERVAEGLRAVHDYLPDGWQMFTEHKPYEPAFYATVNSDWGSSLLLAQAAGPKASCLVDLGHHLPNANIEQIVSRLAMAGRLGGFHFNDSKYGDDDLTTGSIQPFQLFLIFCELIRAGEGRLPALAYMIDQSHNIKDPLEDLIQSTEAVSIAYAQALLVERDALLEAQTANDAALGQHLLQDAFRIDVRPLVAEARRANGGGHRAAGGLPIAWISSGDDRRARSGLGRNRAVSDPLRVLAVDLGATSVRVAAVDLSMGEPAVEVLHRWEHSPIRVGDGSLRWDWPRIVSEVEAGLERGLATGEVASIGVDGWGIDYGLIDRTGQLVDLPFSYRDSRTEGWQ